MSTGGPGAVSPPPSRVPPPPSKPAPPSPAAGAGFRGSAPPFVGAEAPPGDAALKATAMIGPPSGAAVLPRQPAPPQPEALPLEPTSPEEAPPRLQAGKKVLWVAIGAVVLGVIAAAAFFVLRLHKQRRAAEEAAIVTTPVPAVIPTPPPQLPELRVYADLEKAKVTLDGNEVGALEAGQFSLDNLSEGEHALVISDGTSQVKISVSSAHDSMPLVQAPLETKDLKAIVVTNGPQQGQALSSYGPMPVSMDGKEIGTLSTTPLPLPSLPSGTHDLDVGKGKDEKKMSFQVSTAPALTVFLSADRNVGNLLVVASEDGATVLLNGKAYPRTTKRGQLVIANLVPKRYTVSVVKDGFQNAPSQDVNVLKGQAAKLVFVLQPVPTVASLVIVGAPPTTDVLLDGKSLGATQQDGSFGASNIKPGTHTIGLRKERFKPKDLQRQFVAGATVRLNASEVALESTPVAAPPLAAPKLVVQTIAGAQVLIDGRPTGQTGANGRLEINTMPAGDHTLEVVIKPFNNFREKVTLLPGQVLTITPNLLASMAVEHKHMVGGCNGTLLVGEGRIQFRPSSGGDAFDYPLTAVKKAGPADSGKGFYLEITGAKRYTFHAPAAAQDLQIILNAMSKQ